jgi:hypothetical protein
MEYTWKHGIQLVSGQTFQTEDPLEVGKILVDLCTGDKYKILSVAKPRDRTRLPILQTWPAGTCTDEEIVQLRQDGGYTLTAGCKPFTDVRWARTAC